MQLTPEQGGLLWSAADGATAWVGPWGSVRPVSLPTGTLDVEVVAPPRRLGLILVRRGGYAVGLAEQGQLTAHHCGTKYVQSRTAAGGWSQQRFARRRGNQADALVGSVVDRATSMLSGATVDALVVGGDKALARQVLEEHRLRRLTALPRREFHDIPDPRFVVLQKVLRRGRAVQIQLTELPDTLAQGT